MITKVLKCGRGRQKSETESIEMNSFGLAVSRLGAGIPPRKESSF